MDLYQIVVIVGKKKCAVSATWDQNSTAHTSHGITAWMESSYSILPAALESFSISGPKGLLFEAISWDTPNISH
jgi:hypothetical protein